MRPIALSLAPDGVFWRIVLICAGIAVLVVAARVEIPLPFSPVPLTGQTFAVLLIGAALGARLGAVTVGAYVLLGTAGLPVFAGGPQASRELSDRPAAIARASSWRRHSSGWLAERGCTQTIPLTIASMAIGEAAIYLFGLAGLSRFPLSVGVLDAGRLPFVVGDLHKVALAMVLPPPITRHEHRA
jgi:biotin transport system substrate-specific component